MITTACDGCGKQFKLKDEYGGKKIRCKGCGGVFRVPEPEPAADDHDALLDLAELERTATVNQSGRMALTPLPLPPLPAAAMAMTAAPAMAVGMGTRMVGAGTVYGGMVRRPVRTESYAVANTLTYAQWGLSALAVLLLLAALIVPDLKVPAVVVSGVVGLIFIAWSNIASIIVAFQDSTTAGLLYLFLPGYQLYFAITRWDVCAPIIGRGFAGAVLIFGARMVI